MATASLIQFYRGRGFSSYEFPTLPSTSGPLYNGSTIIKSIASGSPWVNTGTNQLFVGSVCINPDILPKYPLTANPDQYDSATGKIYHILDLLYNPMHFSLVNNALNINLNSNDFTVNQNGISINWQTTPSAPGTLVTNATTAQTPSSGEAMSGTITLHKISKTGSYNDLNNLPTIPAAYTLPSANTTTLGGIKPSWSGVITDLEDVFDNKSTTAPALANTENKYYPIISEAASTLNITSDYPYNVFETATATDGRLFTVLRPATRTFAGTIKVSAPLTTSGRDSFPGASQNYRWLDDTTTGTTGINTKITYLARLTNRIDLLNNSGVDLDLKLTGTAYPSASNQTLAQRDSLFETFVPLPLPSTVNPGIAKISFDRPWAGDIESPEDPHAYPIALDNNDRLVAIAPNALVVNTTTPDNGDLIMFGPNDDWGPAKPSRLKIQVNGTQVANFGVEDSTDTTVNIPASTVVIRTWTNS